MKNHLSLSKALLLLSTLMGMTSASALAQSGESTNSGPDFKEFELVIKRNIFDPNRRKEPTKRPAPRTRPPTPDVFTLIGTMTYDNKSLAFFSGTDSQFNTTLKPKESIADHELIEIESDHILLRHDNKELRLKVGGQMRKTGDEPWKLTSGQSFERSRYDRGESTGTNSTENNGDDAESTSPNTESSEGGAPSDLLKKLMERRRQQMNK